MATANGLPQVPNRRKAARDGVRLPGIVSGLDGRLSMPCLVLDMSATGAQVAITQTGYRLRNAGDLPDDVNLYLSIERASVSGTIRWRNGLRFGLRFTSPFVRANRKSK